MTQSNKHDKTSNWVHHTLLYNVWKFTTEQRYLKFSFQVGHYLAKSLVKAMICWSFHSFLFLDALLHLLFLYKQNKISG